MALMALMATRILSLAPQQEKYDLVFLYDLVDKQIAY
jgi:hypothetical protein